MKKGILKAPPIIEILRKLVFLACISLFFLYPLSNAKAQKNWSITAYGAVLSRAPIERAIYQTSDIDESYKLMVIALANRIKSFKNIDLELEGQVAKHFGNHDHMELNSAIILRWLTFPWNQYVTNSFAIGEGLSYATKIPQLERELHEDQVCQLLNFLIFELTFAMPDALQWEFIARLHHRSGARGAFNGAHGGSNALALGIRYRF